MSSTGIAFGSRIGAFGGRTAVPGSSGSQPSPAAKAVNDRTELSIRAIDRGASGPSGRVARCVTNPETSARANRATSSSAEDPPARSAPSDSTTGAAANHDANTARSRRYADNVCCESPRSIATCRRYVSAARSRGITSAG